MNPLYLSYLQSMQTKSQDAQNPGLWVNGMRPPSFIKEAVISNTTPLSTVSTKKQKGAAETTGENIGGAIGAGIDATGNAIQTGIDNVGAGIYNSGVAIGNAATSTKNAIINAGSNAAETARSWGKSLNNTLQNAIPTGRPGWRDDAHEMVMHAMGYTPVYGNNTGNIAPAATPSATPAATPVVTPAATSNRQPIYPGNKQQITNQLNAPAATPSATPVVTPAATPVVTPAATPAQKTPSPVMNTINGIMKDITTPAKSVLPQGALPGANPNQFTASNSAPATNAGFMTSPQGAPPVDQRRGSKTGDFKVNPNQFTASNNAPATNPGFMMNNSGTRPGSLENTTAKIVNTGNKVGSPNISGTPQQTSNQNPKDPDYMQPPPLENPRNPAAGISTTQASKPGAVTLNPQGMNVLNPPASGISTTQASKPGAVTLNPQGMNVLNPPASGGVDLNKTGNSIVNPAEQKTNSSTGNINLNTGPLPGSVTLNNQQGTPAPAAPAAVEKPKIETASEKSQRMTAAQKQRNDDAYAARIESDRAKDIARTTNNPGHYDPNYRMPVQGAVRESWDKFLASVQLTKLISEQIAGTSPDEKKNDDESSLGVLGYLKNAFRGAAGFAALPLVHNPNTIAAMPFGRLAGLGSFTSVNDGAVSAIEKRIGSLRNAMQKPKDPNSIIQDPKSLSAVTPSNLDAAKDAAIDTAKNAGFHELAVNAAAAALDPRYAGQMSTSGTTTRRDYDDRDRERRYNY